MSQTEKNSYLENLQFDEQLNRTPIASYLGNIRLVLLTLIVVIGLGIYSYVTLPRELTPSINIAIVTISTSLPGASPEDIESLVTVPIEDAVESVEDISTITSTSRNSVSSVVIEFQSGVDADEALSDVQQEVSTVRDLPEEANDPIVNKIDFQDDPVWTFSLSAGNDIPGLDRLAERLENAIEANSQVDRVEVQGLQSREIQIVARPEVIRERGVTPDQVSAAIRSAISSYPAGEVITDTNSFLLSIDAGIENIQDIRETQILLGGEIYTIADIATVQEIASPGERRAYQVKPGEDVDQIVTFSVYKISEAKIDEVTQQAQNTVETELEEFPNIAVTTIQNNAEEITDQFNDLSRNFAQTIALVFLVMLLFLGIREAFLASISIPLAFMISFFVMFISDITISFISLFSLLLALGLLVDNAIVIVSAVNSYYRSGKFTPYQTGLLVFKDFFIALISTNITTVWAFLPLVLATGIIGEFIKPIPIIVSATIIASAFVGFFLTLPIAMVVLKPSIPGRVWKLVWFVLAVAIIFIVVSATQGVPFIILGFILTLILFALLPFFFKQARKQTKTFIQNRHGLQKKLNQSWRWVDSGILNIQPLSTRYKKMLRNLLTSRTRRWQVIVFVVFFTIVTYLFPVIGFVKNTFFPSGDQEIIYVSVELPSGTNIETSEQEALRLIDQLKDTQELEFVSAEIGRTPPNSDSTPADNLILFTLNLTDMDEREVSSSEISDQLRQEFSGYNKGVLSIAQLSDGPPAGADINIKYLGPDLEQLNIYANETISYLESRQFVNDPQKSIQSGTSKITFVPDQQKLALYGLSEAQLGSWLRSYASGTIIEDLEIEDSEFDIVFRLSSGSETPEVLSAITIPTQGSGNIPILSLGEVEVNNNPTTITREDGKRSISVSASVGEGGVTGEIGGNLEEWVQSELQLADGYSYKTGGVNEENAASVQSIFQAMGLSAILILVTLVVQLGSFRKAIIVMLVIPLAVSGVLLLFGLFGIPLSFPAMIGLLALFGIVVNNSILVVEKINQNINAGFDILESVTDASSSRLEPIFLTSLTTIIGLVPITLSDPTWQGLGGAIICGLTFSGVVMLFFIPTVYYMWFHKQYK